MHRSYHVRSVLETASAKCQARLSQPTEDLMAAVDHILGYMRMHPEREFTIKASEMIIVGYCDSTWNTERKSFSRGAYIFAMTSRHNERGGNVPVAIMSRVQRILGASAFEAEYIALYEALMKCEYLRKILLCMGYPQERTTIFCDNSSAVAKANGKLIPKNSRHIAMRLDWIEWVCSEGKYETKKIATGDNVSDFLTKPQPIDGIKAFLAFSQGTAYQEATSIMT